MNTTIATNDVTGLVDDLSARWTDSVLELLKASGIKQVSVGLELEAWHTMKNVLQSAVGSLSSVSAIAN